MTRSLTVIIIFAVVWLGCTSDDGKMVGTPDKSKMLGADIRLFQGTEAWVLAKAVEAEDTTEIGRLIREKDVPVDSKEDRFGQSLLIWAAYTNRYNSVKSLLQNGADPNLTSDYSGTSATLVSSDFAFFGGRRDHAGYDTSTALLKLVLDYGGNPNQVHQGKHPNNINKIQTPLMVAAGCCLYKTQLLVEHGADINFGNGFQSVLFAAAHGGKDRGLILKYLLIERRADFKDKYALTLDGDTLRITDLLRGWAEPLESEEYRVKMEIVDFLKRNGMNYWETRVPKHLFANYSKEYLEKY